MIIGALQDAGGQKYLARQALENPGPFMTLLGKIVPREHEITGEVKHYVAEVPEVALDADTWLHQLNGSSSGGRDRSRRLDS